jgi:hypothetical protein
MPSQSPKQHRFMEAIKHSPEFAREAGVPQSVGRDFADADEASGKYGAKKKKPAWHNKLAGD